LRRCFLNGSIFNPAPGGDVFVDAPPGLEGKALELADKRTEKKPAPLAKTPPAPSGDAA
jgi:hypothetical protein